ncbi:putative ribonuclease H-like domain-containing protein, partial [Tanacetum coccineum]
PSWIEVMQEELLQFKLQNVWTLVDLPIGKRAIGTKWVFRNKKDKRGIVFAPVARIEAIKLFFAYASYMRFIVYQMDEKSAYLYGTIEEEVYVCQPPGFKDPHFLDKVYKVEKALYGLHQAPRAWYETLSTYLLENGFRRGTINKTLFIKKDKSDILLVQVYVDDIIFGSIKKTLCLEFEQMMHKRFQMSSMWELTFFLGLQVQQKEDGIFISQDKYVADILKKFDYVTVKTASTPMETNKALVKDEEVDNVDVHLYRSMIGSLMYLTASRPDITFAVCGCARDSPFDLETFSDSDYAGASLDRKSTIGDETVYKEWEDRMERAATTASSLDAKQDSEGELVRINIDDGNAFCNEIEVNAANSNLMLLALVLPVQVNAAEATSKVKTVNGECQIQALVDKKKVIITETSIRSDLHLEDADGTDCFPTATIFEELARMGVKKLEKKAGLRTHKFKRLYKGRSRIEAIDRDAEVTLVETQRRNDKNDDNMMFDTSVFYGDEIVIETEEHVINAATTTKSIPVSTVN